MSYCPNCSAELAGSATECTVCKAIFNPGGWAPTDSPTADRSYEYQRCSICRWLATIYGLAAGGNLVVAAGCASDLCGILYYPLGILLLPWSVLAFFALFLSKALAFVILVMGLIANVYLIARDWREKWEPVCGFAERGPADALCSHLQDENVRARIEWKTLENSMEPQFWVLVPRSQALAAALVANRVGT